MANQDIINRLVPIYQRVVNPRTKHILVYTLDDIAQANERVWFNDDEARLKNAIPWQSTHTPRPVLFIGDSHATHLKSLNQAQSLPNYHRKFLSVSHYVAIGGLKWWTCKDNLNGIGLSDAKKDDYGDQWGQFLGLNIKPAYAVVTMGTNDCDDMNCHLEHLKAMNLDPEVLAKSIERDSKDWLDSLFPTICDAFENWRSKLEGVRFGYIPVITRPYWCSEAFTFAKQMDEKIIWDLKFKLGLKVKELNTRTLNTYINKWHVPANSKDTVLPGLLDTDSVHLNEKGYIVLVRDLSIPIIDYWMAGN